MNKLNWIAVALLSGATTLPLAQGLPVAPSGSPSARTSMPLRTSGDTFTIDQKGQRTGDPLPDVDVSLGPRGPKSKAQGAVIPGGSVLQSGKAADVGNVAPSNGRARRRREPPGGGGQATADALRAEELFRVALEHRIDRRAGQRDARAGRRQETEGLHVGRCRQCARRGAAYDAQTAPPQGSGAAATEPSSGRRATRKAYPRTRSRQHRARVPSSPRSTHPVSCDESRRVPALAAKVACHAWPCAGMVRHQKNKGPRRGPLR